MSLTSSFWARVSDNKPMPKRMAELSEIANEKLARAKELHKGKVIRVRQQRLGKGSLAKSFKMHEAVQNQGTRRLRSLTTGKVIRVKQDMYMLRDTNGNLVGVV